MNSRAELEDRTRAFLAAGSQPHLDQLMAFLAEDAVVESSNGERHEGKAAITAFFKPAMATETRTVRYVPTDFFCDVESQKVLTSWNLHIGIDEGEIVREGVDVLVFRGDQIVTKLAYTKAEKPVVREVAAGAS